MMTHQILSICIPTYNRADVLEKTLANIVSQNIIQVEVIVSDNASNDHTKDVVNKFINNKIKYYNNKKNYGLTYNLIKSLELATSDFAVLLSDEDDINVENIINSLYYANKVNVGLVFGGINKNRRTVWCGTPTKLKKRGFRTFLFNSFKNNYMSGIVFSRLKIDFYDLWREYNSSSSFGLLGLYPHIYIINKLMLDFDLIIDNRLFCSFRDKGKNYISSIGGVDFFSPQGRYDQLIKHLMFLRVNPTFNRLENTLIVNRLLAGFKNSIASNNKETRNYYEVSNIDIINSNSFVSESLNDLQDKKLIFIYDRGLLLITSVFRKPIYVMRAILSRIN